MTSNRSPFAFVFAAALAAIFLLVTGSIGYGPPAHMSLDPATWRRGTWTDGVILSQIAFGAVLLLAAVTAAVRINRRLGSKV